MDNVKYVKERHVLSNNKGHQNNTRNRVITDEQRLFSLALLVLIPAVLPDPFTSVQDMEDLSHWENALIDALQAYILDLQSKLTLFTQKLHQLSSARPQTESPNKYVENPLNAFFLIRRMVREWPLVLHLMAEKYEIPEELLGLPTEEDMGDAVRGLARLQYVYDLNSEQLADGNLGSGLENKQNYSVMTASDCFEMGKYWYTQKRYNLARTWFVQALRNTERADQTVQREYILGHFYLASIFAGCQTNEQTTGTNGLLQRLITEHPNFMLSGNLSVDFRQAVTRNCTWVQETTNRHSADFTMMPEDHDHLYNRICQGFGKTQKNLRCHYVHYDNPRLLIAPFKLEELHLDPPVIMFYDVISDQETKDMKSAFLDVMTVCETLSYRTALNSKFRTCNVGWVRHNVTATSEKLTRRVGDMTNLNMENSEINQVASYGLGGEFMLHTDGVENYSLSATNDVGNRIATFMFYLNDVGSGGRTVFPHMDLAVTPHKGSGIMWFNINSHSKDLTVTLHGACPVLMGSKWVLNKWIHEGGQAFQTFCPKDEHFPKNYMYLNNKNK